MNIPDLTSVTSWIRNGPSDTDGTIGFLLASFLWWRIWGIGGVITAATVAVLFLSQNYPAEYVALLSLVIGILTGEALMYISPKYSVSKNF